MTSDSVTILKVILMCCTLKRRNIRTSIRRKLKRRSYDFVPTLSCGPISGRSDIPRTANWHLFRRAKVQTGRQAKCKTDPRISTQGLHQIWGGRRRRRPRRCNYHAACSTSRKYSESPNVIISAVTRKQSLIGCKTSLMPLQVSSNGVESVTRQGKISAESALLLSEMVCAHPTKIKLKTTKYADEIQKNLPYITALHRTTFDCYRGMKY